MTVTSYVYRSRAADIVAEWEAYEAEHRAWARKARRLIGSWFPRKGCDPVIMSGSFGGNASWVGISKPHPLPSDDDLAAKGWRVDRKHWHLVPFKKTPEGKAIAKAIDATQPPTTIRRRLRGMPSHLWNGMRVQQPGVERHGDAIYVLWACELTADDGYDPKAWKRVRLSEFHRIREAAEEQAA